MLVIKSDRILNTIAIINEVIFITHISLGAESKSATTTTDRCNGNALQKK